MFVLLLFWNFRFGLSQECPDNDCPDDPCCLETNLEDNPCCYKPDSSEGAQISYNLPTCGAQANIHWNLQFSCGDVVSQVHVGQQSLAATFGQLHTVRVHGDCKKVAHQLSMVSNPGITQTSPVMKPDVFGINVVIVVDMDVSDDGYWSASMPEAIEAHLRNTHFAAGTTYELVLAGPDNIYVHYPVHQFVHGDSEGSNNAESCRIDSKDGLINRLKDIVSTMPALPSSLYSLADLDRPDGISWIIQYMHKFLPPTMGDTIVLSVINHHTTVTQSDMDAYLNFIGTIRPTIRVMHHFMLGPDAVQMSPILSSLGVSLAAVPNGARWGNRFDPDNTSPNLMPMTHSMVLGGFSISDDTPDVDLQPLATGCAASPCQNGCSCQASCRDENDYVCVPPAGRPFVGKNCEWEAVVQCTADRTIRVSIPSAAVDQYAMGVANVVVQGCNQSPDYLCNDQPSCGPVKMSTGGFYMLECASNSFVATNGQWTFGQTFVFDRASTIVSMPRPIVRVSCLMQTRPASSVISPQIRAPTELSQTLFWQPVFNFYKTEWGKKMILANNGNRLPNGAVGYIIGERIHVRLTATLNGVPAASLPNRHKMSLQSCTISPGGGAAGANILIISNGLAVGGTPFPVSVDHAPGQLGGGTASAFEGVGFSFQVFTFGAGSTLQLSCTVDISSARRRRSSESENETSSETATVELLLFNAESDEMDDVPVLAMEQDPEVIYMELPHFDEDSDSVDVEKVTVSLGDMPSWFLVLLVGLVLFVLASSVTLYKRRYSKVNDFDNETKVRFIS